jgi:hypothetical protein
MTKKLILTFVSLNIHDLKNQHSKIQHFFQKQFSYEFLFSIATFIVIFAEEYIENISTQLVFCNVNEF